MSPTPRTLAGIAIALAAVLCFATLDTTTKYVSLSLPVLLALWFRYMFQAVATTVVMWPLVGRRLFQTEHPKYQCLRGALLVQTSMLAFFSLKYLPVGEFTAIVMLTPLVITLFARSQLGETVSRLRWLLVIGGFVGTLIIIRPGHDDFSWAMLMPLALVASNAGFQLLTSKLAQTEDAMTMQFYGGWVGALLSSLALPFVWQPIASWGLWGALVLLGVMATIGHLLLTLAYSRAPASTLTPFLYFQIGFAMLGGYLVFGHVPDSWALLGMLLIALCGAAGAWLTLKDSRLRIEPVES